MEGQEGSFAADTDSSCFPIFGGCRGKWSLVRSCWELGKQLGPAVKDLGAWRWCRLTELAKPVCCRKRWQQREVGSEWLTGKESWNRTCQGLEAGVTVPGGIGSKPVIRTDRPRSVSCFWGSTALPPSETQNKWPCVRSDPHRNKVL